MKAKDLRGLATAVFRGITPEQRRFIAREAAYQDHDAALRALAATPDQLDAARMVVASGATAREVAVFTKMAARRRVTSEDLCILEDCGYDIRLRRAL
ncbi:hypothetical protein D9V30_10280 [Mycetocola reblochoni]|uniref:Uncharacterized protein n=2 Tax=Mycetocola reblochoni TaxID=331618 RepID=A0A1R4JQH5_9MICO|nr:hypothetical protein [Mycetocola reblochoni]RLP68367.1 hypothetical protein D9V30_10280 [Mycetocola reblochoni]SJN34033.1 hypothetical protein FM119_08725 [Mycetocola reblochoni REB411]